MSFVQDSSAWSDADTRRARARILSSSVGAMKADHAIACPGRAENLRVRIEPRPPDETHIIFDMDGFGWNDRARAAARMAILLEALTQIHLDTLRRFPRFPLLYQSGVRYQREPPGREDWQDLQTSLRRREGDCEDLATWRAAELRARGIDARAVARPRPMIVHTAGGPEVGTLWHILVRWPSGAIEDPSKKLGMEGSD